MLRWITNFASRHAITPERQAERSLGELRMALFEAEERVLTAQMHAAYYRSRIMLCEDVMKKGVEKASDQRNEPTAFERAITPNFKVARAQ
ncbi:MAG: hypothetical protein V4797_00580 [Paraburkholderia tropica]|uniref:hypothetical protein n=1 Tax=Paraburkholderia TaxID=1822464 RepID=UPI00197E9E61|nr:hypothetical protein [Paraburkholderia sp. Ac-20347]